VAHRQIGRGGLLPPVRQGRSAEGMPAKGLEFLFVKFPAGVFGGPRRLLDRDLTPTALVFFNKTYAFHMDGLQEHTHLPEVCRSPCQIRSRRGVPAGPQARRFPASACVARAARAVTPAGRNKKTCPAGASACRPMATFAVAA